MFILEQIPKTIRQFNPITLMYESKDNVDKYTLNIIIGGSIKEKDDKKEILNDGNGIYISKPVLYERKRIKNENNEIIYKDKIRQLYPNEARLKNLTYGVTIFTNIFISYTRNNKETFYK